jgi:hypothetical protein
MVVLYIHTKNRVSGEKTAKTPIPSEGMGIKPLPPFERGVREISFHLS